MVTRYRLDDLSKCQLLDVVASVANAMRWDTNNNDDYDIAISLSCACRQIEKVLKHLELVDKVKEAMKNENP